jgi:hypothetical protein
VGQPDHPLAEDGMLPVGSFIESRQARRKEEAPLMSTTTWHEIIETCLRLILRTKARFPNQEQQSRSGEKHFGDPHRSALLLALVDRMRCAVSAHRFVNGREERLFAKACK